MPPTSLVGTVLLTPLGQLRRSIRTEVHVKLGLHLSRWNWDAGASTLAPKLRDIATSAEDAGFPSLSVIDHILQLANHGEHEDPMLEAYTTLGYVAGVSSRRALGTVVTS